MSDIPDSHPRAASLRLRDRLVEGLHQGIVTETGLIAHGRGEAFDYLLQERTHPFAAHASATASALLTLARHPVISINGNVAALAGQQLAVLAEHHPRLRFEVNLFHYTPQRARRIASYLQGLGLTRILEAGPDAPTLAGIESLRRFMHPDGVALADVVLVALEDGDRCNALVASGRRVIAIDLNPLSRTAQAAHVTIVDELTRALPLLDQDLIADRDVPREQLAGRWDGYRNRQVLEDSVRAIRTGFAPDPA